MQQKLTGLLASYRQYIVVQLMRVNFSLPWALGCRFLQAHLAGIREHARSFVPITGKCANVEGGCSPGWPTARSSGEYSMFPIQWGNRLEPQTEFPNHHIIANTNGNSRILRRYCTIFQAIFQGYIPLPSLHIGLRYGRYFKFGFLARPLTIVHVNSTMTVKPLKCNHFVSIV